MSEQITIHGLTFELMIPADQVQQRVSEIADELNKFWKDKDPIFLCILNGAFVFASDLFMRLNINAQISFVKLASYTGDHSSGDVKTLIGLDKRLTGRHVVIIEDIVDTGKTMYELLPTLQNYQPESVQIVTLLTKPDALKFEVKPAYIGFEIEDKFVVGYGLDYNGHGRNLNGIYQKVQ